MQKFINEYVEAYVYNAAKQGNNESGDMYFLHSEKDYFICAIADGLGNGVVARQSAEVIPKILEQYHHESLDDLMNRCNELMVQKRGAAVAIVRVNYVESTIEYNCIGNVRMYILHGREKMIYPLPVMGFLSGKPQKMNTQKYNYDIGDLFFLHSDGVLLKSPKATMKQSSNALELYNYVKDSATAGDDATFIACSLLQ
ncbi:PP2C family serine/threonine-protein phosphatase [Sporosarcina highlanderae]|uniref:PP2C family serine/threonine-protein phosphatase n=1 Tax=Sporosarcina highlanderae TaxID=3035916 RepID=A0ABT8JMD8_9BACL|nr:PP2C family serine/threonine-protein phosphatase [Sporosarcina highlanderae]MDN4606318.1 PP2C family serine/threonine-protein phosphatase [Sporosarcina highlanderae]